MNTTERATAGVLWFLAADLDRAHRIRLRHVPGALDHCMGCTSQTVPVMWPCISRLMADEAVLRSIPRQRTEPP